MVECPMPYYTYLYTDPSRNEPIYVGKGKGQRAYYHLKRRDHCHFVHRLQAMKRAGIEPVITFLCKDVDEELALLCEEMAIEKYGRRDLGTGPLLNGTNGGDGASGISEEANAHRALSTKTQWATTNLRDASKAAKQDPAYKTKQAETKRLQWLNPEYAAKHRGITLKSKTCPHCGKVGAGGAMNRYHFDNCKDRTNG